MLILEELNVLTIETLRKAKRKSLVQIIYSQQKVRCYQAEEMRLSTILSWHAFQNQCTQTFSITRSFKVASSSRTQNNIKASSMAEKRRRKRN